MQNLERAELLINQKRYEQAIESLNKQLAESPDDAQALAYLALCRLNLDEPDRAISIAKTALGLDPNLDFALYVISVAHIDRNDFKKARNAIEEAISINPIVADYYGILANIHIINRDFKEAKMSAESGLQINPENLVCRNMLSTAQLKLGDKSESFQTVEKALELDPENAMTHSNYGWGQLEKGSHKKALEHFREALAKDPQNEYARAGMLEALKARYFIYRIFLKYYFFMANLKPGVQWGLMIGIIFANRLIRRGAEGSSNLAVFLQPLSFALIFFLISTWVIEPLFNFFMSLNSYGRYLLKPFERSISIVVGICFSIFVLSLVGWLVTQAEVYVAGMLVGYTLILPIGRIADSKKTWVRNVTSVYCLLAASIGILFIFGSIGPVGIDNPYLIYYTLLIVAFTWLWSFANTK